MGLRDIMDSENVAHEDLEPQAEGHSMTLHESAREDYPNGEDALKEMLL